MEKKIFVTKKEAAEAVRVSPRTIDAYVKRGELKAHKKGASKQSPVRFLLSEVEALFR